MNSALLAEWTFEPSVTIAVAVVAACYIHGLVRRRASYGSRHAGRHVAFLGGLCALFLALESPLDALADHLFCAHQLQHLVLLDIVPICVMQAAPEAILIAGLPRRFGRRLVAALVGSRLVRGVFRGITRPEVAAILMGGTLYFWQVPRFHDVAVLNEDVHYVMHLTMLGAGLVFWWRVLDRRPPPEGAPFLHRLFMLKFNLMGVVFLGAYLAAKSVVLYDVYDRRYLPSMSALTDERIGGFVLWFGCAIVVISAGIAVALRWRRHTERAGEPLPSAREARVPAGASHRWV